MSATVTQIRPRHLPDVLNELRDARIRHEASEAMWRRAVVSGQSEAEAALEADLIRYAKLVVALRDEAVALFGNATGCDWDEFRSAVS